MEVFNNDYVNITSDAMNELKKTVSNKLVRIFIEGYG